MASNEDTTSNDVELNTILATIDSLKEKVELIIKRTGAGAPKTDKSFLPDAKLLSGSDTAFAKAIEILDEDKTISAAIVSCIESITAELQKAKELAKQQGEYHHDIRQELHLHRELLKAAYRDEGDKFYGRNSRKGAGSRTHDPNSSSNKTQIDSSGEGIHTAEFAQPESDPSGSKSDKNEERAHSRAEDAHTESEGGQEEHYGADYDPYPSLARDVAQDKSKQTTVLPSPPESPNRNQRWRVEDEMEQTVRPKIFKQFADPIFHRDMSHRIPASQGESAMRKTPLKRKAEDWNSTEGSHTSSEGSQGASSGKNSAMEQSATKKVVLERPESNTSRNKKVPQPSAQGPSYNFNFTHEKLPTDDEYVKNAESVQQRRSGRNRHAVPRLIHEMR